MRPSRLRLRGIAAWLGVVALACNALTPVHLAFDLAHALVPAQQQAAADHDFVRCLLSVLIGHQHDDEHAPDGKGHHHQGCAVCSAISTLAGFALPAAAVLAAPALAYAQVPGSVDPAAPRAAFPTAYHSRAPPFA